MRSFLLALALACGASAQPGFSPLGSDPSSDVGRIADLVQQVRKSVGDLPPDIRRLAVYQIKTEPREIRVGITRYIQSQIEDVFSREAHRSVVNSPELRTMRIKSTDTSFSISNSVPSLEDLAQLALKLDVDAFVEGACTRTTDDDLLLTLRLFRSRTGEVVWSGNFVSGPNRRDASFQDLDIAASMPFLVLPVDAYSDDGALFADKSLVSTFAAQIAVTEAMTADRKLSLSLQVGYTHLTMIGLPDGVSAPGIDMVHIGAEALGVFFRKADPRDGYWLGTYLGYQEYIPFLQTQHFGSLRLGYRTKPTRHFSLGLGVVVHAYGDHLVDMPAVGKKTFDLSRVGYEISFLHYTF